MGGRSCWQGDAASGIQGHQLNIDTSLEKNLKVGLALGLEDGTMKGVKAAPNPQVLRGMAVASMIQ